MNKKQSIQNIERKFYSREYKLAEKTYNRYDETNSVNIFTSANQCGLCNVKLQNSTFASMGPHMSSYIQLTRFCCISELRIAADEE